MDVEEDRTIKEESSGRTVYLIGKASGAKISEEPIPASYMVLTAVSPVLKCMFDADSHPGKSSRLELPQFSRQTLSAFVWISQVLQQQKKIDAPQKYGGLMFVHTDQEFEEVVKAAAFFEAERVLHYLIGCTEANPSIAKVLALEQYGREAANWGEPVIRALIREISWAYSTHSCPGGKFLTKVPASDQVAKSLASLRSETIKKLLLNPEFFLIQAEERAPI